ncbi:MAG: RluA family pseudouridine synthase [Defluviitaleaceae bacterium]|nr:RluA family pseudouridine synthase [Defluviitaleaceae bacterium]
MQEIKITQNQAGQRLDKFVARHLNKPPASFIHKALRKRNITLNGKRVEGGAMLVEGDVVRLYLKDDKSFKATPKAYPKGELDVIFEDEGMVVVNKPANLLTQPDAPNADSVTGRLYNIYGEAGGFAPVAVNRLDKNTTGIVLCAKNLPTAQALSRWIRDGQVSKLYLGVAHGYVPQEIKLGGAIVKDEETNISRILMEGGDEGKVVSTTITPIKYDKDKGITLLQIQLHTGRSHQIRAHLQSIGHPLVGDVKYGGQRLYGTKRQLLHAWQIHLPDGRSFTAPAQPAIPRSMWGLLPIP